MQFPDRDAMSPEERERNAAATLDLVRGGTYRFTPSVQASGIPVAGPKVHGPVSLSFEEGWYIGFIDGNHVFQGRPIKDLRRIDDRLRECYFHVSFIGGSVAELVRPTA